MLSSDDYLVLQEKIRRALTKLDGDGLKGEYRTLEQLKPDAKEALAANGALFDEKDASLRSANALGEWPKGRGIFSSEDRSLIVFVNEQEHMRIISTQAGSDLDGALERFRRGLKVCARCF